MDVMFGMVTEHKNTVAYHMIDYVFIVFLLVLIGICIMTLSSIRVASCDIPIAGSVVPASVQSLQPLPSAPSLSPTYDSDPVVDLRGRVASISFKPFGNISSKMVSDSEARFMISQKLDVSNFYKSS